MTRKDLEKIEVAKSNGSFYYTGILSEDPKNEGWVQIETSRGEKLRFRKEQIMQRQLIENDMMGDMIGKGKKEHVIKA